MKPINNIFKTLASGSLICAGLIISSCSDNFTSPASPTGNSLTSILSTGANKDSITAFTYALTKAGMLSNLDNLNSGQFTVFAPSNYAFVQYLRSIGYTIGPVTTASAGDSAKKVINNKVTFTSSPLSMTGANSTKSLVGILGYHMISTGVLTSSLPGAQGYAAYTTMQGARLSLSKVTGDTYPYQTNANVASAGGSSGAHITVGDIAASNGVLHITDRVMPPVSIGNIWDVSLLGFTIDYTKAPIVASTVTKPGSTVITTAVPRDGQGNFNIGNAASDAVDGNFNLFCAALIRSEVIKTLLPNGAAILPDFTVFAPTDGAMKTYLGTADEPTSLTALNAMTPADLAKFVNYHIVSGRIVSTDFIAGQAVTTLTGDTFKIDATLKILDKKNAALAPGSQVLVPISKANNLTNAGIVHTIGGVLQLQ